MKNNLFKFSIIAVAALLISQLTACSFDKETLTLTDVFQSSEATMHCTIGIFCDDIFKHKSSFKGDLALVGDGTLLDYVEVEVHSNETVLDVTLRTCEKYGISVKEKKGYIPSMGDLSEFDAGPLSGWTYYVNDGFADKGADEYTVSDGDIISWEYTCSY